MAQRNARTTRLASLVAPLITSIAAALALTACVDTSPDPGYCKDCPLDAGKDSGGAAGSGAAGSAAGNGTAGSSTAGSSAAGTGTAGTIAGSGTAGTSVLTDAQVDADLDAGQDAGPCGMPCPTALPLCHAASGNCVECLIHADCDGDEVCSPDHQCVTCNVDADCKDPSAARCNAANECVGCTQDTQCERFVDTTECDELDGQCKFCTGDTEAEHCGATACKRSSGTCTTRNRGTVATCSPCEADSECSTDMRCVTQTFMGQEVGSYCLYDQALSTCGDANSPARPYSGPTPLTSIDGVSATYCLPVTTCPAVIDAMLAGASGGKPCTASSECGIDQVDDGLCGPTQTTDMKCTYYGCEGPQDCPHTFGFTQCSGSMGNPGFCVP